MSKVLVLYYSSYGHIETMAQAVAEGARSAGATVDIKRVPETVPEDIAKGAYFKLDQAAPVATIAELPEYDAIIVGTPTRFGRMPSQMASFLDQAGGLWARGALNGKVGGHARFFGDDQGLQGLGFGYTHGTQIIVILLEWITYPWKFSIYCKKSCGNNCARRAWKYRSPCATRCP